MPRIRSNSGCWTCRIRKKKCDEVHPVCEVCSSRMIRCHGYGARPDWMDWGEREEAEMERIKSAVRLSYSIRRAARAKKPNYRRDCWPVEISNLSINDKEQLAGGQYVGEWKIDSAGPLSPLQITHSQLISLPSPRDMSLNEEISKVRYFVDRVFFYQHHFYRRDPSVPDPVRGWLLGMNMEAPHFYLSSVAISTLHQKLLAQQSSFQNPSLSIEEYQGYHSMTVSSLRTGISKLPSTLADVNDFRNALGLLATSLQLSSFEVFCSSIYRQRGMGDLKIYLDGAEALLSVIDKTHCANGLQIDLKASNDLHNDRISSHDIIGLTFSRGIYVWADIIYCATMGWHRPSHRELPYLGSLQDSSLDVGSLMGCNNWVMVVISEISRLEALKRETQFLPAKSKAEYMNFYPQMLELEKKLLDGIKAIKDGKEGDQLQYNVDRSRVTLIFALAAMIYLYITSWNAQAGHPIIHSFVECAIRAIRTLPFSRLKSISWPFCVAGCMASDSQKDSFRNIMVLAAKSGIYLGTTLRSLDIMEKWWKLREARDPTDKSEPIPWRAAMKSPAEGPC